MGYNVEVKSALSEIGVCINNGAHVICDGQFGSTGKGLVAGLYAEMFAEHVKWASSNAGPNSGHTSYFAGEKIVLQQLPTFAVTASKMGIHVPVHLNGGAIIDPAILYAEMLDHDVVPTIHPAAAIITSEARNSEGWLPGAIGSTGKGVGAALARKVARGPDAAVAEDCIHAHMLGSLDVRMVNLHPGVIEVSQGYSLGINAGFYPHCTSRDCTVAAAISDAGLHPYDLESVTMVIRTYPIRVAGNSGPCYSDQNEITWEDLGVTPEITTVTKKVRRVFTFSKEQLRGALLANRPDVLVVNFMNYLPRDTWDDWISSNIVEVCNDLHMSPVILLGTGPLSSDVTVWNGE